MNRSIRILGPLLAAWAACVGGCASTASMDARYDASLQRWKGATRAELEAAWGRPTLAQATPDGAVLTWIVRTDMDDRAGAVAAPVVTVVTGRANGGATAVVTNPGLASSAAPPVTCTTRFTLQDGHVASWTFEGLGCGAPN